MCLEIQFIEIYDVLPSFHRLTLHKPAPVQTWKTTAAAIQTACKDATTQKKPQAFHNR
jgi:hypothetical protein